MDFLVTVCTAAIASALFRMLIPENKFSKQISLLIACVFLLTAVNAVTGAEFDLSAPSEISEVNKDFIGFSGDVNKSLQKKICGDMSDKLYALLRENGITPKQIHVDVNISGLYSISITRVKLVLEKSDEDKAEAVHRLVSGEIPEDIEIVVETKRE